MIFFSIVIATAGRPERLSQTLRATGAVMRRGDQLIVVDNDPRQSANATVDAFAAETDLDVICLVSSPYDKSKALNGGIQAAKNEWIAFTDDDTVPEKEWLEAAARFAEENQYRAFGGRITAEDPTDELPGWLQPGPSGVVPGHSIFVRYDPLTESGKLTDADPVPYGANFFMKKSLVAQYGGYDEKLWSLCGNAALGAEDAEFGYRLRRSGEAIGFCREAVVRHPVNNQRCTLRIQTRLAFYHGWRESLVFAKKERPLFELYRVRFIARKLGALLMALFCRDSALAVDCWLKISRCSGAAICRLSSAYRRRIAQMNLRKETES